MSDAALRIVLVDDDKMDRAMIRRTLLASESMSGVQLTEAVDCAAALEVLKAPYDCALIDMRLPDGDALDILTALREAGGPTGPVIILTGLDDEEAAMIALKEGAQDYLVKGRVADAILVRSIRYAMERFRIQTELAEASRKLERVAFLDPLTRLLNRRGLEHILPAELARADRESAQVFAVLVDCDDFKGINERVGHSGGDLVLEGIARRLQQSVRREDHCARIGGDEFLVMLVKTPLDEAVRLAERMRHAIASTPIGTVQATASLGVFAVPTTARVVTDILTHAADTLANSKRAGKNTVSVGATQGETLTALVGAAGEHLRVVSQAIHRLQDDSVVATEFFVRGPSAESPEELFALARSQHRVAELDLRCLGRALEHERTVRRHVNLETTTLLERLDDVCERLAGGNYCVEVSARRLTDPHRFIAVAAQLAAANIALAVDHVDFGARSLEALVTLRPQFVKVSPKLTLDAAGSAQCATWLARWHKVATTLGAQVIATKIEAAPARDAARAAGIELAQGFLWDKV